MSKFGTKRFVLSAATMLAATWLTYGGHLSPEWFAITMLGAIAGHHAEDIVKAARGTP